MYMRFTERYSAQPPSPPSCPPLLRSNPPLALYSYPSNVFLKVVVAVVVVGVVVGVAVVVVVVVVVVLWCGAVVPLLVVAGRLPYGAVDVG